MLHHLTSRKDRAHSNTAIDSLRGVMQVHNSQSPLDYVRSGRDRVNSNSSAIENLREYNKSPVRQFGGKSAIFQVTARQSMTDMKPDDMELD